MQLSNQEAERLVRDGVAALQQGRAADARTHFESVTQTGRANGQIWMLLAMACRSAGDRAGEEAALDQMLALEPRAIRAHIMKGDCRLEAGDELAALSLYTGALMLAKGEHLSADLLSEVQRAENAAVELKRGFEGKRDAILANAGFPPDKRSARFQQSLDIMTGKKQLFLQEPTGYYFPGLPQIQYFDTSEFDWVPAVEAATDAIRAEIEPLLAAGAEGFRPYIQAEHNRPRLDENQLLDNADWSAFFLCENGREFEERIALCPETWKAVQQAPLPRIPHSPTVMFSLLRPGARITPHTGTHNTRLTCHLPLIVPEGCRFRVGNEVREWEVGKLLIFDDAIEHEAWNDSDRDRLVLIFDIWRPELSEQEKLEIGALFSGPALGA
jgi:aspartyl/asparaginyl beta-hydroxylase (cupin superfamily)